MRTAGSETGLASARSLAVLVFAAYQVCACVRGCRQVFGFTVWFTACLMLVPETALTPTP